MSTPGESIRERIGSLTQRLADRVGRSYGTCRSCERPSRSHRVGSGVQCHRCYLDDEPVLATDGGRELNTGIEWAQLIDETRAYLYPEETEPVPVPVEEVLEQAKANHRREDEVRQALQNTDELVRVGGDLAEPMVRHISETTESAETDNIAESNHRDHQPEDGNPSLEAASSDTDEDDDLRERSLEAFAAAMEYYHQQLDHEIPDAFEGAPDTPREYYEEYRGWDPDTIATKQLGYAPAGENGLLDYLMQCGFDGEAIMGTGLFYEGFTPHFEGRYVLPYFDEDGRPVYAISRSLNRHEDGHPQDPKGNQKYTKAQKTPEFSHVNEPIYGANTVESNTDCLLVAGGIADAISIHEAGYACISPVTTVRFKSKHEPRVVDMVEDFDLDGVYMLNDAERATIDKTELNEDATADTIGEVLTIHQYGEGLRGAFGNAEFLLEEDVDPYLVTLPGGDDDLRKLDPDEYIKHCWGSVDTVLRSARHADDHVGYQNWESRRRERAVTSAIQNGDSGNRSWSSNSDTSAVFDLSFTDVSGLTIGDRLEENPLGHHGESYEYFVCAEKRGFEHGYDHKYNVAYNGVSWLLCDAGVRPADEPNGPLSDWEVFRAWEHAKSNGHLPDDDPVPYRGLCAVAVEDGLVDRKELVERDTESGEIVDDPDTYEDETYTALPSGTYNEVLSHIADTYGVEPGRDSVASGDSNGDGDGEEYRSDPTELDATVDPRRAWSAAGNISPSDLSDGHSLRINDDAGTFACSSCGEPVDVVRAVAIADGSVEDCSEPIEDTYPSAYQRAREQYGAPLPEYYTTSDAIARFDAVLDVIGELTFWDLHTDALSSEITGSDGEVSGAAVRTLNPSWRDSESEESVLVFDSGTIWDADGERTLDAVRFVALDSGLIDAPTTPVEGAVFKESYRRCREDYGAPLPRWDPATDGERTVTPLLPDASELVDTREVDGVDTDALGDARERVEALVNDATAIDDDTDDTPKIVTALPATGKTTATIKTARERPTAYLAPRKELQQQAVNKADRWGVNSYILPVFSEENIISEVLECAVAHVREHGKDRLRDRWGILNAVVDSNDGIFVDCDDDGVDLDRATCPTADGAHGEAWALTVHVARYLGYSPEDIHTKARALFGTTLPCCENGSCEYGEAWEDVRDRDNCPELLVGSYIHSHVESVRTTYDSDPTGGVDRSPRAVVFDEFPGEAFTNELGPEAFDFATWLARSLREDIDDRRDMFDADLYSDDWVRAWLEGTIGESEGDHDDAIVEEVECVIHSLSRVGDVLDARDSAAEIVSEYTGALEELGVARLLTEFVDGTTPEDEVYATLSDRDSVSDPDLQRIYEWICRDVREPLQRATHDGSEPPDADIRSAADTDLPIGGDLATLVDNALEDATTRADGARERISAAVEALRGGPDGCRQLAAWADDGYAHPDAHHIFTGIITPTSDDSDTVDATRIDTSSWAFDPDSEEGTVIDVVSTTGNATTIVDRNDHGARLHTPPSRIAGNGEKTPFVGLDATGRAELWRVVLGEEVRTTDIFDTARERRRFLENTLDLRVIQTADRPRYYEGDPATKDTDGDAALLEAIADEYSGIKAPRQRGDEPERVGKPAAITTLGVKEVLSEDPRLDDVVDTWDNYGNVTGKNELGDHRLAAILGCQHYGDDAIEQFAALAGEEVDTDRGAGRGADLEYDSEVANAYLDHMTDDQTMQAILRFARGEDGGATVVARTSALRSDLPVVGRGDVVETWSDTATSIVDKARSVGGRFTIGDVSPAVDVGDRQVRRVLSELVDAGYLQREDRGPGRAHKYEQVGDPGAGEVSIPDRDDVVPDTPRQNSSIVYYTRNVRVFDGDTGGTDVSTTTPAVSIRAPPAPGTIEVTGPPG